MKTGKHFPERVLPQWAEKAEFVTVELVEAITISAPPSRQNSRGQSVKFLKALSPVLSV